MYFSGFILVFAQSHDIFLINGYSHFFLFVVKYAGMIIAAAIINNIIIAA